MDTETDGREKFKLFLLKECICFHKFCGILSKSSCSIGITLIIYIECFLIVIIAKLSAQPCHDTF